MHRLLDTSSLTFLNSRNGRKTCLCCRFAWNLVKPRLDWNQYRGMISVSLPSTKRLPSMKRLSLKPKFWISSQELIRGNTVTTLSKPCLDVMVILNWSLVAFLLGMQKGAYFGMQSVRDRLVPVSFETRHVCSGLLFLRWLMIIT